MTIEAGVVIDASGKPIYWHLPHDRTGGSLPDSQSLWDVLWNNRDNLSGFAHSHPGSGLTGPSYTDITTFAAVEAALGKRLLWPIITSDSFIILRWFGPDKHKYIYTYGRYRDTYVFYEDSVKHAIENEYPQEEPVWIEELRKHSNFNVNKVTNEVPNGGQYYAGQ